MTTLTCCHMGCPMPAAWGILSEGATPDLETHSCDDHLSDLLEIGISSVWPLAGRPWR